MRTRGRVVLPLATAAMAALTLSTPTRALVWPDVPERIERSLRSPDAGARRIAARELSSLGQVRAEPLVLRALEDPSLDVRLAAAQSAIHLRITAATDAVLPWLGDREPKARLSACEVAKAMPSPRAVAPLARTLGDADANVRGAAADALGMHGSEEAVAPLLGKLDDPNPPVRVQLARALARLGDARAVVPLVGKVQDSVPEVRQAVVRALGELGDPRAVQALVLALRDVNTDVRIEALAALGRLRADASVDAVASLLSERSAPLRQAAFAALGRIASKGATSALVAQLGAGEDAAAGLEHSPARDALITVGAAAEEPLLAIVERPRSAAAATSAAWILGELRARRPDPRIEGAFVAALRRGTLPVASALRALAGCGSSTSVAVVLEFVADENPGNRAEALRTAAVLLDPKAPDGRAVEPLAAALREPRLLPQERVALVQLLGRTGAPRAAAVLSPLVSSRDPALRLAAIDAMGAMGKGLGDDPGTSLTKGAPGKSPKGGTPGAKGAEALLLEAMDERDPQVRLHAAMALEQAGSAASGEALLARLDGSEETDRRAIFHALRGIVSRTPSEAVVTRLIQAESLAAGPERDAILEVLGHAQLATATEALIAHTRSPDPFDRRAALSLVAARPGAPRNEGVASALRSGLSDADASVRAQAAWAIGSAGDLSFLEALAPLLAANDADVAINAVAAIGRVAARHGRPDRAAALLCPRLEDARGHVRANALAGLVRSGAVCSNAATARKILAEDPNDDARLEAATVVSKGRSPDDLRALDRCSVQERNGTVAARCRALLRPPDAAPAAALPARTDAQGSARFVPVTVFIATEGSLTPRPNAAYVLRYADGFLRAGLADRRGAFHDPMAPEGSLELRRPGGGR